MKKEKIKHNGTKSLVNKSGKGPSRFALMTKKDNVKVARKK